MKRSLISLLVISLFTLSLLACKKSYSPGEDMYLVERKVRLQLWTTEDFSNDNSIINFSVFIKTERKDLFDSSLASMRVKDIPDSLHRIIVEKTIKTGINTVLSAGFISEMPGIGITWHLDTIQAGNRFKTINYSFK